MPLDPGNLNALPFITSTRLSFQSIRVPTRLRAGIVNCFSVKLEMVTLISPSPSRFRLVTYTEGTLVTAIVALWFQSKKGRPVFMQKRVSFFLISSGGHSAFNSLQGERTFPSLPFHPTGRVHSNLTCSSLLSFNDSQPINRYTVPALDKATTLRVWLRSSGKTGSFSCLTLCRICMSFPASSFAASGRR